jgi:hypothetical protein
VRRWEDPNGVPQRGAAKTWSHSPDTLLDSAYIWSEALVAPCASVYSHRGSLVFGLKEG